MGLRSYGSPSGPGLPCLREEPELRSDRRLPHVLRMRLRPANEDDDGCISRGRWVRGTDEGLGSPLPDTLPGKAIQATLSGMHVVTITAKRQATLPAALCKELGLAPGAKVAVERCLVGKQTVWVLKG